MTDVLIKQKIKEFLKHHTLCVISTVDVDKNAPESAVVGFAEKDNLEIVIGTSNLSRKYKNLQKNNHVSLVIGWSSETGTIQYEGVAKELSKDDALPYIELHVKKNPFSKQFTEREDHRYFLVTPTWIRILDLSGKHPDTYEVTF